MSTALRILNLIATLALAACAGIVDRFSGRGEACAIVAIGTPANARILRLIDTGTSINDDPVVEFVLEVSPADAPTFEAHARALISRLDIPAVQPGRVLPVRFDPQDHSRVAIDLWDCPPAAAPHDR
jgi:hypothetical protein